MVRGSRQSMVALGALLITIGSVMACSSDDSSSPQQEPFDSGSVTVPEAGPQAQAAVTVQVQGSGTVQSSDAQPADGGTSGTVVCSATSPATQCVAPVRTTLYAIPAVGWVLSGWTTTGLAPGVSLAGTFSSYTVTTATPSPLIAVFIPQAQGGSPPPSDAGGGGGG
jgi:hypothetical protein